MKYDNVIPQDSVINRHPLTISLTPELADFVATEVRSGQYGSASEVIRAGLRLLTAGRTPTSAGQHEPQDTPTLQRARKVRKEARNG